MRIDGLQGKTRRVRRYLKAAGYVHAQFRLQSCSLHNRILYTRPNFRDPFRVEGSEVLVEDEIIGFGVVALSKDFAHCFP